MSSNSILRSKLKNTQDYNQIVKNREFGQSREEQFVIPAQLDAEASISKKVKAKINETFGERILIENKLETFKVLLRDAIISLLNMEPDLMNDSVKKRKLAAKIMDEILGYGAIQDLLERDEITEIMVSRWDKIFVEQKGRLELLPDCQFQSDEELRSVIERIVQPIGRRIDESEPLVDARLRNGSRVNATVPPISPDGCTLTIRKFSRHKLTGKDYLGFGSLNEQMLEFLRLCIVARCNVVVSGGTGTGKTTLLNMLSNFIPANESIITIEDSCELQLNQNNVRRLEARPMSAEGTGEVSIRRLVKNSLRMRPDRIVVGEIRDGCIVDMLRAMSSGHDGSLTTVHANSPKDMIEATLPILFGMSDMKFTELAQKQQICSAIDLIVQINRLKDGSRKITNITHVVGLGREGASKLRLKETEDSEKIYLQDIFKFKQEGIDQNGYVIGRYECTGYEPKKIINKLESIGVPIAADLLSAITKPKGGNYVNS